VSFNGAEFCSGIFMPGAVFLGEARFQGARLMGEASLDKVAFAIPPKLD
jgi:hypothetical protein